MAYTYENAVKYNYVVNELAEELIAATGGKVRNCDYRMDRAQEIVTIVFQTPKGPEKTHVDVTGDSPWGIHKDVTKAV
jgi:hypothetical protein